MAKFRTLTGKNSIPCDILNENYHNYVVQFKNGVVKEVSKSRVYDLNNIDEGVLDTLKNVGSKIKSSLIRLVKNAYGVFFYDENDRMLPVVSPYTIMMNAKNIDGVGFMPGKDIIAGCNALDMQPIRVDDIPDVSEEESIAESLRSQYLNYLFEHSDDRIEPSGVDSEGHRYLIDHTTLELKQAIENNILWLIVPGERLSKPLCIWGPPGVGKTSIISDMVESIASVCRYTMLSLNARNIQKDDLQMSIIKAMKNGKQIGTDLPKEWLPVYKPDDYTTEEEKIKLDEIANGTIYNDDGTIKVKGYGGVLFIDELSRINEDVLDSLMGLFSEGKMGSLNFTLGSKWLVIGAANRRDDMTGTGKKLHAFEAAHSDRILSVNFVPTVEEWLEWARRTNKKDGKQNVIEEVCEFLSAPKYKKYFYYSDKADLSNKAKFTDINRASATPRRWTDFSDEMKKLMYTKSLLSDPMAAKIHAALNTGELPGYTSFNDIPLELKRNALYQTVGVEVGDIFLLATDSGEFSLKDAENVWKVGKKGTYKLLAKNTGAAITAAGAIENTIVPKLMSVTSGPNDITPGGLLNVYEFGWKLACNNMPNKMMAVPIFKDFHSKLYKAIVDTYNIDYMYADNTRFTDVQNMVIDITENEIVNNY